MLIVPSSYVKLYRGIEIAPGEQIAFKNRLEQTNYFEAHKLYEGNLLSYVRRTGEVKLQLTTAQVAQCNYISFSNPAFEGIIFYASIADWEYVNNSTTRIRFAIDAWQTFWDVIKVEQGLVVREHLSQDEQTKAIANPYRNDIVKLLTAETLPVGDQLYIHGATVTTIPEVSRGEVDMITIIIVSDWDFATKPITPITQYAEEIIYSDGTSKSGSIYDIPPRGYLMMIVSGAGNQRLVKVRAIVKWLTQQGLYDSIMAIYWCAASVFAAYKKLHAPTGAGAIPNRTPIAAPQTVAEAGVQNPKLLRGPYRKVFVTNLTGGRKEYLYELGHEYQGKQCVDLVYAPTLDMDMMIAVVPLGYGTKPGIEMDWDERIEFREIPQAGYTVDAYYQFLATQYQKVLGEQNTGAKSSLDMLESSLVNGEAGSAGRAVGGGMRFLRGLGSAIGSIFGSVGQGAATGGVSGALAAGAGGLASAAGGVFENVDRGEVRDEALKWAQGNPVAPGSSFFGPAEWALSGDRYVGATGGMSALPYVSQNIPQQLTYAPGFFGVEQVQLAPAVESIYDNYLSNYGYAYNSGAVPLIMAYVTGVTDPTKIPFFADEPGNPGVVTTFCKTSGIHVVADMRWVAEAIEGMFNAGVRFRRAKGGYT